MNRRILAKLLIGVALILIVFSLSFSIGCSKSAAPSSTSSSVSSPVSSGTQTSSVSISPAIQSLYDAAKKEGEVVWQLAPAVPPYQPVIDAFKAKYPGIKVNPLDFPGNEIIGRIITESQVKKITEDVAMSGMGDISALVQRNLLPTTDWASLGVDSARAAWGGRALILTDFPAGWVYNPKFVSQGDVPRTFQDLLDPKWKGYKLVCMAIYDPVMTLFPLWQKDKQQVADLVQKLKDQQLFVTKSTPDTMTHFESGESPVACVPFNDIPRELKQGVSIAFTGISPAVGAPFVWYYPEGAPHPNAAKLLLTFLESDQGQQLMSANAGASIITSPPSGPVDTLMAASGVQWIRLSTDAEIADYQTYTAWAVQALGFIPQ